MYMESNGEQTCEAWRLARCKYTEVVLMELCPINSCIIRMLTPCSSKWVAKQCRRVWNETLFFIPALSAQFLTMAFNVRSERFTPALPCASNRKILGR